MLMGEAQAASPWAELVHAHGLDTEGELDFYRYLKDTGFQFKGCTTQQLQEALAEWSPWYSKKTVASNC